MARQRKNKTLKGVQLPLFDLSEYYTMTAEALQILTIKQLRELSEKHYGRLAYQRAVNAAQPGEHPDRRKAPWIRILLEKNDPTEPTETVENNEANVIDMRDRIFKKLSEETQ